MLQNATPLRKSAPWPPNISDEHVSCTAPATENASLQILFKCPTPAIVFGDATKPSRFAHFWQGAQSLAPATRNDIWTSKSGPAPGVFNILTSKCALRHNGVHFFDISTSKSGPELLCFVRFDFKMCFAPQRRALFRHLNFQKWSGAGVFCTFWLGNALRASVQFFDISTSKSGPDLVFFVHCDFDMCFAPQRHTIFINFSSLICPAGSAPSALAAYFSTLRSHKSLEKHSVLETFLLFGAPGSSFFLDFLFFDLLSSSLLFSDSSHLCFSFVHIVGSLASKLPSTIYIYTHHIYIYIWSVYSIYVFMVGRVCSWIQTFI